MSPENDAPRKPPGRRSKALLFRLLAVLLGLTPLFIAECAFIALDWGRPDASSDPFLGFLTVRPLFVLSDDDSRYEIPLSRQAFFRAQSFDREKGDTECRIFCLGGSTVQGRPFAVETSFTTWLELSLRSAAPDRDWQVVNCGGVSYASYRLVPILEEVLEYEPDLIILYTGHNEFLEDRTYDHLKRIPGIVAAPSNWLARMRTFNVLRDRYLRFRVATPELEGKTTLRTEVDAMLDYRGGLEDYRRDDTWRQDTIEHFQFNLRRMVRLTQDAQVPLLLVNPVSMLRGCPPFKSQQGDGLAAAEIDRRESLIAEAVESRRTDPRRSLRLLQQALAIDDQHAGLHYLLASHYDELRMPSEARRHYLQAKELDICPLRMLEPMHDALLAVARNTHTPIVDVRRAVEGSSIDGIPDGEHLLDHVHPTMETHKQIAGWLMDSLRETDFVRPVEGWESTRDSLYRQHFESLDDLYFVLGTQRLEALRAWTQGAAEGQPGQTPATRAEP